MERFCETRGVKKRHRVPARQSRAVRRVAKIANVGQIAVLVDVNPSAELFLRLYTDEHIATLLRAEVVRR